MKNMILLLIVLLLFSSSTFSQLDKNTWLVGGSWNFYSYNETYSSPSTNFTSKYTNIDISASVGYFFITKLAAGLRPNFSSLKGKSSGGAITDYYRLAIGPFARYYFLNNEKPFNLIGDVGYQFGINKDMAGITQKGEFNTFYIMGGTEIFFNTSAGLEILIGYAQRLTSLEDPPSASNSIKKGFQVSIGFTLHLEK